MSLETALQSDGNSKINFYLQRKGKDGKWETICSVYSPCNFGKMSKNCCAKNLRHLGTELNKPRGNKWGGPA